MWRFKENVKNATDLVDNAAKVQCKGENSFIAIFIIILQVEMYDVWKSIMVLEEIKDYFESRKLYFLCVPKMNLRYKNTILLNLYYKTSLQV